MTALPKYDRLEAMGLWRNDPHAQRRDVFVSFGDASLIIRDRTDAPLAHWSLAAIERIGTEMPALYHPGAEAGETLEIEDAEMVAAVEKIRRAIARRGPHHGRVRLLILAAIVAVVAGLAIFWLPAALTAQAVAILPDSKRIEIGERIMTHVTRLTGGTCTSPLGQDALDRLTARVLGDRMRAVHIVPDAVRGSVVLPGKLMLLNRELVEDFETPAVAAGHMIAGALAAESPDQILPLLDSGGISASFTLLTTGDIGDDTLRDYAETLIRDAPSPAPDARLPRAFSQAKVALSPYAYSLDITGESTVALIEADPYAGRDQPRLLPDGDWLSLQAICGA